MKTVIYSFFLATLFSISGLAQTISLNSPIEGSSFISSNIAQLEAGISNPAYLHITNTQTGFRKLKIGYNAVNLYSPMYNVTGGGNTTLEITLCNFGAAVDWSKMSVRPQGNTATPVLLAPYIAAAGGLGTSWKTISIPLSAFSATINFAQISLIELPYSSGAGSFDIGISKIAFTGGSSPYIWFGPDHTSNLHNGNGGSGELVAQLVAPAQGSVAVDRVDFYAGFQLLGSDNSEPYGMAWTTGVTGIYELSAKAVYVDGTSISSSLVGINVIAQPVSQLSIAITSPIAGSNFNSPADVLVTAVAGGFSNPDPALLHVTNTETGYRKLKLGYSPTSLYSPFQNVVAGGNTTLEITMKDASGNTNWNKIQIRPQGSTIAPVNIAPYVAAVGGIANQWKTIAIPLSAFDPSINFSQLSLIELPYSLSAGILDLGIQQIRFTGGTTPFTWFGGSKTDNLHNGNGGAGELVASVVPSIAGGPSVDHVDFFVDNILTNSDYTAPFECLWSGTSIGLHTISARLTDNAGLSSLSDVVNIQLNAANPNTVTLTVTFASPPTNVMVQKAALRYNKTFAYSFTLDDGLIDAYTVAFPLLNGGLVTGNNTVYPGYFYSDGCGNAIPFSAGLSWYSVSTAGNDLHVNTPSYVTWNQLATMYNAGWNVFNHSYSHAANGTTDYVSQITQNTAYVKAKSGIDLTHFVIPSGDQGYVSPAFANGMLTVNGNNGAYRGSPNGYRIDQPVDFNNVKLYKMLVSDANQNTANIMQKINNAVALSVNGQHYWWSDFTHHVGFQSSGASLFFPLFQYYMESVAQQYGIGGADNIWMAPTQDVYEYLSARDKSEVNYSVAGNTLTIAVDYSAVPANMRTNALTLVIQADQDYTNVVASGAQGMTFKGTGSNKLINIKWGSPPLKASATAENKSELTASKSTPDAISVYPNPFTDHLYIDLQQVVEGEISFELLNMDGKTVFIKAAEQAKGGKHFELNLRDTHLNPGIYLLKSANGKNALPSVKIIKIQE